MPKFLHKFVTCIILCGCLLFTWTARASMDEPIIPLESLTGKARVVYMTHSGINEDFVYSMHSQEVDRIFKNALKKIFKDYPQLPIISASSRRSKVWETQDLIISLKLSGRRELKNSKETKLGVLQFMLYDSKGPISTENLIYPFTFSDEKEFEETIFNAINYLTPNLPKYWFCANNDCSTEMWRK